MTPSEMLPKLVATIERIAAADGDYYTDAPECADSVEELTDAIHAASVLAKKANNINTKGTNTNE